MKLNRKIIERRCRALHADYRRLGILAGLTDGEAVKAISYAEADPEVVGRIAAFCGLDPEHITAMRRVKAVPKDGYTCIDGYKVECRMAVEDLSYTELTGITGIDAEKCVFSGLVPTDALCSLAAALYVPAEEILLR